MKTVTYDDSKWKLVPVEPTEDMVHAACQDGVDLNGRPVWKHTYDVQAKWRWKQMLASSPDIDTEISKGSTADSITKPEALRLADWTDWFCRNVKDPQDFRWIHMAEMAEQLRSLYKQLDSQQHVLDNRLNQVIELETERDELLRALQKLHRTLDESNMLHDDQRTAYANAGAAITKATGEKS